MSKTNGAWRNRIVGYGEEPPDQLIANPLNFRIHPKAQQEATTGSLDTLGWIDDVIVNRTTGHVVDGHLRITLALRAGAPTIPVKYVELTEAEEEQALLSLDPIAAMAATDKAKLDELIRGVQTDNKQVMEYIAELAEREGIQYGAPPPDDPGAQIDKAEELREKWGVESGQMWQLGEHRLICGDSTNFDNVEKLKSGKELDFMITDPPYGIGFEYGMHEDDPNKNEQLVIDVFLHAPKSRIWTPGLRNLARELLREPKAAVLVWNKKFAAGFPWHRASGATIWEPILVTNPLKRGLKTDYLEFMTDRLKLEDSGLHEYHPCPKPIGLWKELVDGLSEPNMLCYDPFLGSGTTLIVCQQIKRICYGSEIDPAYCAVAIQRWVDMTGGEPVLLG